MNNGEWGRTWRPGWLIGLQLAAAVLLGSWLWEPSRALLWEPLDQWLFLLLNGTLDGGHGPWSHGWALANHRAFDAVAAFAMLGLYALYVFGERRAHADRRMAELLFMLLLVAALIGMTGDTLMDWVERPSPSLVLEPVVRLSQLYPEIKLKDASGSCFPSDHGMVLATWSAYLWLTAGHRFGIAGTLLAILFLLPRLVGGGHWLTDTLVGGAAVATVGLAWAFATPLQGWGVQRLTPAMRPLARLSDRLLGLVWK